MLYIAKENDCTVIYLLKICVYINKYINDYIYKIDCVGFCTC